MSSSEETPLQTTQVAPSIKSKREIKLSTKEKTKSAFAIIGVLLFFLTVYVAIPLLIIYLIIKAYKHYNKQK